eukprot:8949994-Pyramimonas_sp.AAC.1
MKDLPKGLACQQDKDGSINVTMGAQGTQRSTWQCTDPCRASRTTNGDWATAVSCANDLLRRSVRGIPIGIDAGGSA